MRRLCIGDVHGKYDLLVKVLDLAGFSGSDDLYSVGDFTDRGTQNVLTLDFLMSLGDQFKPVCGNHDLWNYEFLHPDLPEGRPFMGREAFECWYYYNGGRNTVDEEFSQSEEWQLKTFKFLRTIPYKRDLGDRVIIHSLCYPEDTELVKEDLGSLTLETLKSSNLVINEVYDSRIWGRDFLRGCEGYFPLGAKGPRVPDRWFKEKNERTFKGSPIYVTGHTPLARPFFDEELGIVGIDTGSFCTLEDNGIEGSLTLVDLDSWEYWNSLGGKGNLIDKKDVN